MIGAAGITWNPAVFSKVVILCTNPNAENTYKNTLLVSKKHILLVYIKSTQK
ncbi:hypothetical protein Hanom_Chr13g01187021 [Helianthus anomalus]